MNLSNKNGFSILVGLNNTALPPVYENIHSNGGALIVEQSATFNVAQTATVNVAQTADVNVTQTNVIANTSVNAILLAAYIASTSATLVNPNAKGIQLAINVTAYTLGSLTPVISGFDLSGNKYPILTGPAIAAVGLTILRVYPGLIAVANATANDILPLSFEIEGIAGTADSITYEINANLIL